MAVRKYRVVETTDGKNRGLVFTKSELKAGLELQLNEGYIMKIENVTATSDGLEAYNSNYIIKLT